METVEAAVVVLSRRLQRLEDTIKSPMLSEDISGREKDQKEEVVRLKEENAKLRYQIKHLVRSLEEVEERQQKKRES